MKTIKKKKLWGLFKGLKIDDKEIERAKNLGNPIIEPISGCDCGLTGGCPKCRPDLYKPIKYNLDDFIGILSDKEAKEIKEKIRRGKGLIYEKMVEMLKRIDEVVIPADCDRPDDIIWKIAKEYGITPNKK